MFTQPVASSNHVIWRAPVISDVCHCVWSQAHHISWLVNQPPLNVPRQKNNDWFPNDGFLTIGFP